MTRAWPRYADFYRFALGMGLGQVARGDLSLGRRKTLGKVFQPINAVSRFPEYALFYDALRPTLGRGDRPALLDLGSPKPFGLFLAAHHPLDALLTDINAANQADYEQLWRRRGLRAPGAVAFREMDARATGLPGEGFDIVISMSVIEHIEGDQGDRLALAEMWRLLRRGGRLVVSVPFGSRHVSQHREGFSYFGPATPSGAAFFQRIYDEASLDRAMPPELRAVPSTRHFVHRVDGTLLRAYRRLGLEARAVIGPLSPLLARVMTRTAPEFDAQARKVESYGAALRIDDVYSDVVMSWRKP